METVTKHILMHSGTIPHLRTNLSIQNCPFMLKCFIHHSSKFNIQYRNLRSGDFTD